MKGERKLRIDVNLQAHTLSAPAPLLCLPLTLLTSPVRGPQISPFVDTLIAHARYMTGSMLFRLSFQDSFANMADLYIIILLLQVIKDFCIVPDVSVYSRDLPHDRI